MHVGSSTCEKETFYKNSYYSSIWEQIKCTSSIMVNYKVDDGKV